MILNVFLSLLTSAKISVGSQWKSQTAFPNHTLVPQKCNAVLLMKLTYYKRGKTGIQSDTILIL